MRRQSRLVPRRSVSLRKSQEVTGIEAGRENDQKWSMSEVIIIAIFKIS